MMESLSSLLWLANMVHIGNRVLIDTGIYLGKFLIFAVPYTVFAMKINNRLKYPECMWVTDKEFNILKGPAPKMFIDVEYSEDTEVKPKLEHKASEQKKIEHNKVASFINEKGQMSNDNDFWI